MPNVFVNGRHIGGHDDTKKAHQQGLLNDLLGGDAKPANKEAETQAANNVRPAKGESIESFVNNTIKNYPIVVFSKSTCPYCAKVKELFKTNNLEFVALELDKLGKKLGLRFEFIIGFFFFFICSYLLI